MRIALHVPDKQWASFSKWATDHIRVVAPEGVSVDISILPELDGDVDFDQFGPKPTITFEESVPK